MTFSESGFARYMRVKTKERKLATPQINAVETKKNDETRRVPKSNGMRQQNNSQYCSAFLRYQHIDGHNLCNYAQDTCKCGEDTEGCSMIIQEDCSDSRKDDGKDVDEAQVVIKGN
jgi:hypothetical protein